jgi:hypothetical protein
MAAEPTRALIFRWYTTILAVFIGLLYAAAAAVALSV